MKIWPFGKQKRGALGIDIGTSAIRVVELSRHGDQERLENYAQLSLPLRAPRYFGQSRKGKLLFSTSNLAEMLARLLAEAKIESNNACFSIPDFSSFFTTFKVPVTDEAELPEAVKIQSQQYIPLPLSEITLDWQLIKKNISDKKISSVEVLLVAVPNQIIHQYQEIARLAFLDLKNLEAEVFGLIRTLVRNEDPAVIIDIGQESTTCSIVDKKILKVSHSFDLGSGKLVNALMKGLNGY